MTPVRQLIKLSYKDIFRYIRRNRL